jgi:hypothetical protein
MIAAAHSDKNQSLKRSLEFSDDQIDIASDEEEASHGPQLIK